MGTYLSLPRRAISRAEFLKAGPTMKIRFDGYGYLPYT